MTVVSQIHLARRPQQLEIPRSEESLAALDALSISDYEECIEATSQGIKELSLKLMGMEKSLW